MRLNITEARDVVTLEIKWLDAPLTPPVSLVVIELLFCVSLARMGTREMVRPVDVRTNVLPSPLEFGPARHRIACGADRAQHACSL